MGTVEAVENCLSTLKNQDIKFNPLQTHIGTINESHITFAAASDGFFFFPIFFFLHFFNY